MLEAVIRVSGAEFDPDHYVSTYGVTPDVTWRTGDLDFRRRVFSTSGFNLTIGDADSGHALVQQVRGWVENHTAALLALRPLRASGQIDVGLTVGTAGQFTASVTLEPSDLALLAEHGVELRVSAYPTNEEPEYGPAV